MHAVVPDRDYSRVEGGMGITHIVLPSKIGRAEAELG